MLSRLLNFLFPPPIKSEPEWGDPEPVVVPPIKKEEPVIEKVEAPKYELPPWMIVARGLLGTQEIPGSGNNQDIIKWAKDIGGSVARDYVADSIPWCGLFMAITQKLGKAGTVKTPLWAKSWADYGVKLVEPAFGCIMVFERSGGGGHVAYYISEDDNYYHILGGNQTDNVTVTRIAKGRLIAMRWPPNSQQYYKPGRIFKAFDGAVSVNEA